MRSGLQLSVSAYNACKGLRLGAGELKWPWCQGVEGAKSLAHGHQLPSLTTIVSRDIQPPEQHIFHDKLVFPVAIFFKIAS